MKRRSTALQKRQRVSEIHGAAVLDFINRILGYDIFDEMLLLQGYREYSQAGIALAEDNLAAMTETLPADDATYATCRRSDLAHARQRSRPAR